jgi:hypothetical protein
VPVSPIRDLYPGKALIAVSKAAPLVADIDVSVMLFMVLVLMEKLMTQ